MCEYRKPSKFVTDLIIMKLFSIGFQGERDKIMSLAEYSQFLSVNDPLREQFVSRLCRHFFRNTCELGQIIPIQQFNNIVVASLRVT